MGETRKTPITLDPHCEMLLAEYRKQLPKLQLLAEQVNDMLSHALREQGIELNSMEYRVKAENSLAGKLERKGNKYQTLSDITDLIGLRVITFYTDDVDKVAAIVKHLFKVDWSNSVDKRKLHELNSFGYNSLHYICYLKPHKIASEELKAMANIPFEIQMRTALQHVWSAIEHDIGYKGKVKLPPEYRRQFSRLAGMLELADDEFSRLRTTMSEYRRQVQSLVNSGQLDEVALSTDSFNSYLELHPFDRLNQHIAAANQAEIFPMPLMSYLKAMEMFGFQTLGDIQRFIDENKDDAYQLALSQLAVTDLDILAENVGIQNLCLVHILKTGGGQAGLKAFYDLMNGENVDNALLADNTLEQASTLPFMSNT